MKGRNKGPESARELQVPRKSGDPQGLPSAFLVDLCYAGSTGTPVRMVSPPAWAGSGTTATRQTLCPSIKEPSALSAVI